MEIKKLGKLIAIEGFDGAGKETQTNLLVEHIQQHSKRKQEVSVASFPMYSRPYGLLVREYLQGGPEGFVDMATALYAAMLYAGDRRDILPMLSFWLEEGRIVIADRYTPSNLAHQAARLEPARRAAFQQKIYRIEHEVMQLPKPDLVLLLTIPVEVSQRRTAAQRNNAPSNAKVHATDIHEQDAEHLAGASAEFMKMATNNLFYNWVVVDCCPNGLELTSDEVHEKVWEVVKPVVLS